MKHGKSGYTHFGCRCEICTIDYKNYQREYYLKNTERIRLKSSQWYRDNYDYARRQAAEHYQKNKKAIRAQQKKYEAANQELLTAAQRKYYSENRDLILENQKRYRERHRWFVLRSREKYNERLRRIPNTRNGCDWSSEEDAVVLRNDISFREMCYLIGRSYGAVTGRRSRLLMTDERKSHERLLKAERHSRYLAKMKEIPCPRKSSRWTKAEDAIALRDDIPVYETAAILGRTYKAVHQRRNLLRKQRTSA